ncbi:hypothetical protein DJ031_02215 [bacterium endosymbiont of Escarpia laminata]|nr:MAG: hypothetical protein DJ031_02215 [bacterium endosymbiont of Escarpia laminata]
MQSSFVQATSFLFLACSASVAIAIPFSDTTWIHDGHYYGIADYDQTWDVAQSEAASYTLDIGGGVELKGHLLTINDASEQAFVEGTFIKNFWQQTWLGAYQYSNSCSVTDNWSWVTGEEVGSLSDWSYTNFDAGQPEHDYERVARALNFTGGKWHDFSVSDHEGTVKTVVEFDTIGDHFVDIDLPPLNFNNTPINLASVGELSIDQSGGIIDQLFGLANVRRIDDRPLGDSDQLWAAGASAVEARVLAKFTGYAAEGFGVFENIASAPYREALVATSNPFYADPLNDLFTDLGVSPFDVYSYGMESNLCGTTVNSIENRNTCVRDHMVTWEILNGQSAGNFILAWEDLTDNDFNDLVLEVRGAKPVGTPEPAAWLLFFTGYLIFGRRLLFQGNTATPSAAVVQEEPC